MDPFGQSGQNQLPPAPPARSAESTGQLPRIRDVGSTGQFPAVSNTVERYGDYELDLAQGQVRFEGGPLPSLTPKEFALCLLLFRNANRALSRDYIASSVWGWNVELSSRTMDSHISKLRLKMGLRPQNGVRLSPVYGFGYRLETLSRGGET